MVNSRAVIKQQKTSHLVQFEITEQTRDALTKWIHESETVISDYIFSSRINPSGHLSTRQYVRLASRWFSEIGLDPLLCGTHILRRTKASYIYSKIGNIRAVQLLLGHTKLESTVRYLGIEVENALTIAEQVEF